MADYTNADIMRAVRLALEEKPILRKWIAIGLVLVVAIAALGVGLFFDLRARGAAWNVFWSLTGEEEPLAQIRGMVEFVGNITRPQPSFDTLVPVDHANLNPFGINTFLQLEVEPEKVEQQLKQISEAGFAWIRQEFQWEDIEIHARGDFEDRRNVEAEGILNAWAKYDRIVELAEQYGIQIQARISNPPIWAQASDDAGDMAPPALIDDYVNFAVAVAQRYQGRIRYYQIWNEPNIYPEWGEADVDPEQYTELLCRTHDALKAIDPELVIISGALAPTIAMGPRNLNDFIFLERMYAAGAGDCFDVMSMQGYGLNSGPTDRRMRPVTVNVGRSQYIRELMVKHGDSGKPIWLSEAAWNAVPTVEEHPEAIDARENFGRVTLEQQARYMPLFYDRIRNEWPWVNVVNYWFFTQPDDSRADESFYYFRMAEPDYSDDKPSYTTLPVYDAMREYIATHDRTMKYGVHQLDEHWLVSGNGEAAVVEGAQFEKALETANIGFQAQGTRLALRWQGGTIRVSIGSSDEKTFTAAPGQWHTTELAFSPYLRHWSVSISSDTPVLLDSVTVDNQSRRYLAQVVGLAVTLTLMIVGFVFWRRRKA